nr:MAG TPA: hypothetical protein [Caudoviricetes sp.]
MVLYERLVSIIRFTFYNNKNSFIIREEILLLYKMRF